MDTIRHLLLVLGIILPCPRSCKAILKVAQTEASAAQVSLLTVLNVCVDRKGYNYHFNSLLYFIKYSSCYVVTRDFFFLPPSQLP